MNGLKRSALDSDESHPNNKRKVESTSNSLVNDSSSASMEVESNADSPMTGKFYLLLIPFCILYLFLCLQIYLFLQMLLARPQLLNYLVPK